MIIFREIFNWSNLFLVFLVFTSIFTANLNNQSYGFGISQGKVFGELRVIKNEKFKSFVSFENQVWELDQKLTLGNNYKFEGKILALDKLDRFDKWQLANGIKGKIELQKKTDLGCDLICSSIKQTDVFRNNIQTILIQNNCLTARIFANTFDINCDQIGALSVGLVVGGTEFFDAQTKQDFKNLGLTHLIAVSGFQVILVLSALEFIFAKLPKKWRLFFVFTGILGLILLVGPQAPVLRSSFSIAISVLVLAIFGKKLQSFRTLCYSGILMLCLNSFYLESLSFQLSFVASFGLIFSLKTPRLANAILEEIKQVCISSIYAFLFTLPLIIQIAGQVSLIGIFANIVIVPMISFVTAFNLLGLIPFVGEFLILPASLIQSVILFFAKTLENQAFALTKFGFFEAIIYYFTIIFVTRFIQSKFYKLSNSSSIFVRTQ